MKVLSSFFIAFASILLLSLSASAQVEIYALGSSVNTPDPRASNTKIVDMFGVTTLYKLNPANGVPTAIGPTGFYSCQGMDMHPVTDELYAVCNEPFIDNWIDDIDAVATNNEEQTGQMLVKINMGTGQGTAIGPLGDGIGVPIGYPFVSDISFRPDGTLYAHVVGLTDFAGNQNFGETTNTTTINDNTLGTIDLQTGQFNAIGPTEFWDSYSAIGFQNQQDLFQCANDTSFFSNRTDLNSLNPNTGLAAHIRQIIFPPEFSENLNIISSKDENFETGIMYALFISTETMRDEMESFADINSTTVTNNIGETGNYLATLNQSSGLVEVIGYIHDPEEAFLAIAVKGETRMVPTLSEYGLILTVALFLGAAVIFLRRRQLKSEI